MSSGQNMRIGGAGAEASLSQVGPHVFLWVAVQWCVGLRVAEAVPVGGGWASQLDETAADEMNADCVLVVWLSVLTQNPFCSSG